MSVIDVNSLLTDISPEAPSGEDLEYDPAFSEMERAVQGKPEQSLGDATVPAEPPDWRTVRKLATEMLARSKDLRVAVCLARALAHSDGYSGFSDGLSLVHGLLERHWDTLHPQLDADDNNDPTFRVNTVTTLCDREAILNVLRAAPLVSSRALGRFGLHDMAVARGELQPPADSQSSPADMPTVEAAFMDTDVADLQATADAITRSRGDLAGIDALLMDKIGSGQAPDLGALEALLKEAQVIVSEQLVRRGAGGDEPSEAGNEENAVTSGAPAVNGDIRSREDAMRMMDKIANYFKSHEPSSPVPLLMQRARRLVNMDFLDVLKDVAPEGLKQAKNVGGISDD